MTDTLRVCVIGNSHMAAAKKGWDLVARDMPEVEPVFFGAQMSVLSDLEAHSDRLSPSSDRLRKRLRKTSGGYEEIVFADYDAFVLYGLHFGPRSILKTYRHFRPMSFEWAERMVEMLPLPPSEKAVQRVPEGLFDRSVLGWMESAMAITLADVISADTAVPIVLVAAPGFNERVLDDGVWDGPLGAGDVARLAHRYTKLAKRACPDGVGLVMPRASLLSHGLFTARAYAAPDNAEGLPDNTHTDARYGAEMMRHAISAVKGRLQKHASDHRVWRGEDRRASA